MVHARLHIICGNCGSNDDFKLELHKDEEGQHIWIICDNCSTVHDVQDNAEHVRHTEKSGELR